MITLGTKGDVTLQMPQSVAELPDWTNAEELFLDVETKRVFDHSDYGGLYPWKGDEICGVAVTVNDEKVAYYLPIRHDKVTDNLPLQEVINWLVKVVGTAKKWINHNILLDAAFCWADGIDFTGQLVDTLTLSKVHDTDRMSHGLKALRVDWLGEEDREELMIKAFLDSLPKIDKKAQKSYSAVPAFILGKYACGDVVSNRNLYRYLVANREKGIETVWDKEIALTPVLFDMEVQGILTDNKELLVNKFLSMHKLAQLGSKIASLADREFTNSNQCMHDILIMRFGMPILATKWEKDERTGRTYDTGRPTFDKEAMALYQVHPMVLGSPKLRDLIDTIQEFREEQQFLSLFVDPFLTFKDTEGFIHPTYNQLVRTSRMSCGRPNAQQQNKRSKKLWKPRPGYGFISCDYSQIEFRLIVHFIRDVDAIAAYNNDPNTDFHQWVADMIGIKRRPAKTLNFGMGYGAGKKRVQSELSANPDIIREVSEKVVRLVEETKAYLLEHPEHDPNSPVTFDGTQAEAYRYLNQLAEDKQYLNLVTEENRNDVYNRLCQERASQVWEKYHETLPGIRVVAEEVEKRCRMRGFVKNPYGRRRHLPLSGAHKAFNSLVQGTAMDIIKEQMIFLSPRYNQQIRDWDIRIVANVHDEVLFEVPLALLFNKEVHQYLIKGLESPSIQFRVPITTGMGVSANNWYEASGDGTYVNDEGRITAGKLTDIKDLVLNGTKVPSKIDDSPNPAYASLLAKVLARKSLDS